MWIKLKLEFPVIEVVSIHLSDTWYSRRMFAFLVFKACSVNLRDLLAVCRTDNGAVWSIPTKLSAKLAEGVPRMSDQSTGSVASTRFRALYRSLWRPALAHCPAASVPMKSNGWHAPALSTNCPSAEKPLFRNRWILVNEWKKNLFQSIHQKNSKLTVVWLF